MTGNLLQSTPMGNQIVSEDADSVKQLESKFQTELTNDQTEINVYSNKIDETTKSNNTYENNIANFKEIIVLNDEELSQTQDFLTQFQDTMKTYSENINNSTTNFSKADTDITDAEDAVYTAKINYYQAMLDNMPSNEIEQKINIVNESVDNLNTTQQEFIQAQRNFQSVLNAF